MSTTFSPYPDFEPATLLPAADAPVVDPVVAAASRGGSPMLALAVQVMRFGTVGSFGFLWDLATFTALLPLLGFVPAAVVAFLVAATMNWLLNRLWTFRGCTCRRSAFHQWLAFLGANSLGFALNRGTMFLLAGTVPFCLVHPVLALAAGSLAGMCANFGLARRIVFRAATT